jgi:FtsZ-binding cell division protein ZapB
LLLNLISRIENPELKRQYLEKLRKLLTKREVNKSKSLEISLSNTLKRFDKPKEQITIKYLQLEVNQIKSEIKILKEENQELKQDVNFLKIEYKLKSVASSQSDREAKPEPKPEDTPQLEENCLSLINRIHIRKWYSKVKFKIQDFELSVVVLIDTGVDLNCIQEGLVPTKYYSKSKETLRSSNGSKMQITFEISKAHVCQDNVCFKTTFVLVKNMTDKVILGLPFITLLYPFTTDQDGLITYPMDEKVKFKFLGKPERSQLNAFKSNSISKSVNLIKSKAQHIEFLQEEIKVKRIEEQLSQKVL